jgi:hypothetical protein
LSKLTEVVGIFLEDETKGISFIATISILSGQLLIGIMQATYY